MSMSSTDNANGNNGSLGHVEEEDDHVTLARFQRQIAALGDDWKRLIDAISSNSNSTAHTNHSTTATTTTTSATTTAATTTTTATTANIHSHAQTFAGIPSTATTTTTTTDTTTTTTDTAAGSQFHLHQQTFAGLVVGANLSTTAATTTTATATTTTTTTPTTPTTTYPVAVTKSSHTPPEQTFAGITTPTTLAPSSQTFAGTAIPPQGTFSGVGVTATLGARDGGATAAIPQQTFAGVTPSAAATFSNQHTYQQTFAGIPAAAGGGEVQDQQTFAGFNNTSQITNTSNFTTTPPTTPVPNIIPAQLADKLLTIKRINASNAQMTQALTEKRQAIDVCFLMDLTGTMKSWLVRIREKIVQIISTLQDRLSSSNASSEQQPPIIRVAFVGYSDYDMATPPISKTVYRDFSMVKEIITFMDKLLKYKFDGEDSPEDVLSGLSKALSLSWSARTKILIHIADDPAHNREFHDLDERDDRWLNGPDPSGRGPQHMYSLLAALCNKNIEYHFFHLDEHTEKMERVFDSELKKYGCRLIVHDMGDEDVAEAFLPTILNAINDGRTRAVMRG